MIAAYVPCSRCGGSGMVDAGWSIRGCEECGGDCMVRARDERGRFISRRENVDSPSKEPTA